MIKLWVLKTDLKEDDLFFCLVSRGRQTGVPGYFSVKSYSWEDGWVVFIRLDCALAPTFEVGVAGSRLLVSEKDRREVDSWLRSWKVEFTEEESRDFSTPPQARRFLSTLRRRSTRGRIAAGRRLNKLMRDLRNVGKTGFDFHHKVILSV